MNKKPLAIALFALVIFGPIGSTWGQLRCLSMMSAEKSSCCCPTDKKSHCPSPVKKSECPMMVQANLPDADVAPARLLPTAPLVVALPIEVDSIKPILSFKESRPALLCFRTDRRHKTVPPLRAPPAA